MADVSWEVPSGVRPPDPGHVYEVFGETYTVLPGAGGYDERGEASWYGDAFDGRPTATGETFDMYGLSAAHRTLPLHTFVEVTNLDNDARVIVRINDRGPFARTDRRIVDLSYGAARRLGMVEQGIARVRVRAVAPPESR
jgi:rare lipoprotein A